MAVTVTPPKPAVMRTPRPEGRTGDKIALCGSHSASLMYAPWADPSWEFWGHSCCHRWYPRPMDVYFDLHVKACWTREGKKDPTYVPWLSRLTKPIYMPSHFEEVPASIRYPKERILTEFSYAHGRKYFTNHLSWMIALAITEGVKTIGVFGMNYGTGTEYERQRGSAEYWLGQCDARGIKVILPEACTLLNDPKLLYGYESHDEKTGLLKPEYKRRDRKKEIVPVDGSTPNKELEIPAEVLAAIEREEQEHPRPDWSLLPGEKGNGGVRKESHG